MYVNVTIITTIIYTLNKKKKIEFPLFSSITVILTMSSLCRVIDIYRKMSIVTIYSFQYIRSYLSSEYQGFEKQWNVIGTWHVYRRFTGTQERFPIRVQILSRRTHAFRDVDKHGYRRCEFTVRSIRRSVDRNTR